jgi:hypothetical protein
MKLQVHLLLALGAVHNFICIHDPKEIHDFAVDTLSPNEIFIQHAKSECK